MAEKDELLKQMTTKLEKTIQEMLHVKTVQYNNTVTTLQQVGH